MSPSPRQRRLVDVFPFWGYGSVITAVLGVIACITILCFVNNKEIDHGSWTISPNVLLSICVAIINISLHLAHTEGLNVVWWRRAQAQQANPHLLHESWERADSLFMAVASVHRFDIISLATIFVALAPIAGPFLQRAVKIVYVDVSNPTTITFPMAQQLPLGFSGFTSVKDNRPTTMSWPLVYAMQQYQSGQNMSFSGVQGCLGICNTTIRAAGFDVVCRNDTIPWKLPSGDSTTSEVFGTDILFNHTQPNVIQVNSFWKEDESCTDTLSVNNCTLTASTIDFPVIVSNPDGFSNTTDLVAQIDYYYSYSSDDVIGFPLQVNNPVQIELDSTLENEGRTTIGGVWLALQSQFGSRGSIQLVDEGYDLILEGTMSNTYLWSNDSVVANSSRDACPLNWYDPSWEIIGAAQDLMLRLAAAAADPTWVDEPVKTNQTISNVSELRTVGKYKSKFAFLGAALVFSSLGIIFVAPLLHRFWDLKQWGTMSPLETAKYLSETHLTPTSTSHGRSEDSKAPVLVNEREIKMS